VSLTRCGKRAEESNLKAGSIGKIPQKQLRSLSRSHGMGTRRPETNPENLFYAFHFRRFNYTTPDFIESDSVEKTANDED